MLSHVVRNEEQWNAFAAANGGGFLQSWEWASFQEAMGRSVFRFRLDAPMDSAAEGRHEDTLAQCTVIELALPMGKTYAYVPMGPLVRLDQDVRARYAAVIEALREAMARSGAVFTRIEPPYELGEGRLAAGDLEAFGLRFAGAVQPRHSNVLDLSLDEDALQKGMHHKTRYNIRLSGRKGVMVREADHGNAHRYKEDISRFWSLLEETSERDAFHTHDRAYYETMLDALSVRKGGGCKVRLWFAEHEGDVLAAAITAEFGDTVTYLHGASTSKKRALMAPHALHWRIITEAKANGYAKYDFWGVAPDDETPHPWGGITRFKRGFGGNRTEYLGAWDLPGSGLWYTLYRLGRRLRR